jgi:hypothetical protein
VAVLMASVCFVMGDAARHSRLPGQVLAATEASDLRVGGACNYKKVGTRKTCKIIAGCTGGTVAACQATYMYDPNCQEITEDLIDTGGTKGYNQYYCPGTYYKYNCTCTPDDPPNQAYCDGAGCRKFTFAETKPCPGQYILIAS